MTARSRAGLLLATLLALPAPAAIADEAGSADAWLDRMNRALHELNYEGRFVYQHGQTLEAMYLAHTVTGGEEREHLLSLTGVAREVIRDGTAVTCVVSGGEAAHIDRRPAGRRLTPVQAIRPDQLGQFYRFELGGKQRVAGRVGQAISIIPRDQLRYGYWLLLDEEHALPLATATLASDGRRISQLLFTDLRVGEVVGESALRLEVDEETTRHVRPRHPMPQDLAPRWSFQEPPGGFQLAHHRRRLMGNDDHEVEHFIFSDGLATVSVYVEEDAGAQASENVSRLGAVTALSRALPGYQVTAVGEVPQATLRRFLDGIAPEAGAP